MPIDVSRKTRRLSTAVLMTIAMALTGCASSGDDDVSAADKGGIPSAIKLIGIRNQTGPVSYTGISAAKGTQLAIKQITEQSFLGANVKITVDERDSAFDPGTAASQATSGLAKGDVTAVLGPQVSSEALAVAPIAQKAGVPIIYTQSGVDGLLAAGDMQFRASPPQKTLWPIVTKQIVADGGKKVAIFSSASNPTYHEIGGKVVPALLADSGVQVVKSFDLEASVTDFQAPVSSAFAAHPDTVIATLVGSQIPTLVVQLRQAGYTGPIYTGAVNTDKDLATMGKNGVGIMFVSSYSPAATGKGPAEFTAAYKAEYGGLPDGYAAEAYDATWWVAHAIKKAGSVEHAAIAKALKEIGAEGFTGAQGPLTFENGNDARAKGLLVRWNGSAQTVIVE